MKIPFGKSLTAALLAVCGLTFTGQPSTAASVSPYGCISQAGYIYGYIVNHGLVFDGKGTPTIYHNGTTSNSTMTLTQTATGTVDWSVNGSITNTLGLSFKVVEVGLSTTFGETYTSSNSTAHTVSISITVPVSKYGILQAGAFRRYTTGRYYYDYGNCQYSTGTTYDTKVPVNADGYNSVVNSTGIVPWDQQ